jgi:carboxyl-terminal processing protease
LVMKILALTTIFLLLTACGGGSNQQGGYVNPIDETPSSGWVYGQYKPSSNFAKRCINPRFNDDYRDIVGSYVDENNWLRSWSNETYLWYNELPDIDPATITNPVEYFDRMKTDARTSSGQDKDRFHFTYDTDEWNQLSESGISVGYGAQFTVTFEPYTRAFITYTEPNSPARSANIGRGTEIIATDGILLSSIDSQESYDLFLDAVYPSTLGESHTFTIRELNADADRTVILQSAITTEQPVHTSKVFTQNNKKIGYVLFNSFNVATAEEQLINTISSLVIQNIDELILDLRYNAGGYLAIATELGSMIAGDQAIGSIYTELAFNDKRSMENESYRFPSEAYGLSVAEGTVLPQLNLSKVYILSSGDTASASEYLINGLRGIDVEVILIGGITTGKPYGFLPEDNCGTTYFTIQFKGENAKGYGDFADGFIPSTYDNGRDRVRGCVVTDDLSHLLGDENERMLATALHYIENNQCPVTANNSTSKPVHPLSTVSGRLLKTHPTGLILR